MNRILGAESLRQVLNGRDYRQSAATGGSMVYREMMWNNKI